MHYNQSGIAGNLASVHLSDLMLSFEKNKQTGTLQIGSEESGTKIYIRNGAVYGCTAPLIDGLPFLMHTALRREIVTAIQVADILKIETATGQSLRQSISRSRLLNDADVDVLAAFCIEERIFPLFQMTEGYFAFNESESMTHMKAEEIVELKDTTLRISHIILEAARRNDEWERLRSVVDSTALYIVDTRTKPGALRQFEESNPEAGVVARYLDGKSTLYAVASKTGVGLLEIHVFVSELVHAGLVRVQTASEVVTEAIALQQQGFPLQACDLLETVRIQNHIEEVLRPLAAIYQEINRSDEAVAIFSELSQASHDRGRLPEALADVDTAIAISPNDPELHYLRARICTDLGDNEGAASGYRFVAQTMRSAPAELGLHTPAPVPVSDVQRQTPSHGIAESPRPNTPKTDQHTSKKHAATSANATRQSGQYAMGDLPKTKTDPLIPARLLQEAQVIAANDESESVSALSAEDITLLFKITRIPAPLVNTIKNQLQKVIPESQAKIVLYQAVSEAKSMLDFQRNIDTQLQGEMKGAIIMAIINRHLA